MKKLSSYLFLISVGVLTLGAFSFLGLNSDVKDYLLAKVTGGGVCPKGDGKAFDDEVLVYVNKDMSLPSRYIPKDLIDISKEVKTINVVCLKKDVVPFLKQMFTDAGVQNINLAVTSGFRSDDTQLKLYNALIALKGETAKDRIAKPSHSEHQLGTTMDFSGESIDFVSASDRFNKTAEDLWLRKNAYKYGFVMSYGKDKKSITGYDYEPWHYRFVGVDVAKIIFDKEISIEEYFSSVNTND